MEQQEELRPCENCGDRFPVQKIDLHEAYCRRNIRKCKICAKMVDINDEENHQNQFHAEKECEYCHNNFQPNALESHMVECSERPIQCKFCQNPYPYSSIIRHQEECGSRTRRCDICRKYVKISEFEAHTANCQIIEIPRNQSQEMRRHHQNGQRQRRNSNQQGKKEIVAGHRVPNIKAPVKAVIGREPISQLVDPVPISVRLAMQREKEKGRHR